MAWFQRRSPAAPGLRPEGLAGPAVLLGNGDAKESIVADLGKRRFRPPLVRSIRSQSGRAPCVRTRSA